MINALIDLALKRRALVLILVAGIAGLGIFAFRSVPIDSFPDVTPPMVQIFTSAPGLAPKDVETQISFPIEKAMYGLPHLDRVQSTSLFGLSRVTIYFKDGTGVYFARQLVAERLNNAKDEIPAGLGTAEMGAPTTGLGDVLMYRLRDKRGYHHSLMEKRTIQDWLVKPRLRTVPGVTDVLSAGGYERQYQVRLDLNAMLARDITVDDVRRALDANNRNVGASFLQRAGEEYIIRGHGWISPGKDGLRDIREILVSESDGTAVHVGDIANVTYGPASRRGTQVANGKESVGGDVYKLVGTNTQDLLGRLDNALKEIDKALPQGLTLEPYYSQADLVANAIGTVRDALLEGAALVLVILYLFLGNLRSTLIVVASLPLAALIAFIAMDYTGMTANLMSLGGLAIGIGMMVDGSVVMVENIFRLMESPPEGNPGMLALVRMAAHEVAQPIVFAIAIIIIVFLPLFTLQGVEGKMFSPMAYTISFALAGALLLALTLVPVLSSLVFRPGMAHGEPRLVRAIKAIYRPLLNWAVRHPAWVTGVTLVAFLGSLALFPLLGSEFVPTLREGTFYVESALPPGGDLDSSIAYAKKEQAVLKEFPEVTGTYSRVGRTEVGGDPDPINSMATTITLKPLDQWNSGRSYEQLQSAMAERLEKEVPELSNNFSQPIQLRTDELITGVKAQVVVSIYGDSLEKLQALAGQIKDIADDTPGAADVAMVDQFGKPQIEVEPDRRALARYGVSVDTLLSDLETGIGGSTTGQVFEGTKRFDIQLRLAKDQRSQISDIRDLPLRTTGGAIVPLSRVAKVKVFVGPKEISRNDASRRAVVMLNVRGRDMGGVVKDIQTAVSRKVQLPAGYFVKYGGQFKNQRRAMHRLYVVVPITLGLIFLLLFFSFNSLRYAALIFLNVPFAVTGGIVSLYLSGLYLSVPGAVGFIAVFGVAVLNGVVLVSYINQLRAEGMTVADAVRLGAERRLRPVLMTASVAILGLIPLLLANGIGANVQRPLAAVVVGGLFTSTLLTLVVLPSIYRFFAPPRRDVRV
ncbi:MAG TPA: CusA/CzcA family heavy metal efflux RND transporter [Gammaproteobacteria bacterium]|nr:CusA/CzcA family heavy metal efflux RND transporter [Gammaproteobacteria bacterium]